ncbi:uncharacterized protein B0I36DRAFT_310484 [Microdochium trichocladiopsis]|uniref:Uncharacterized protein n=1 Tax=Microdochium trichocladiopsis TaxID=1682393 RepID=A0A9P8YH79_9PEZI|nr:uncharacterized protein B0I36DRAFT_310484 [Microdochium trichocladiopsis]KAH7040339.1 hypothetical protein B0I36DRAFT_310484 [Microdochium trichocladiopsis]
MVGEGCILLCSQKWSLILLGFGQSSSWCTHSLTLHNNTHQRNLRQLVTGVEYQTPLTGDLAVGSPRLSSSRC